MQTPPICIRVKLSHCRNMPTKTFYRLLDETRMACDRSRNAMLRAWQRWREDNPDWQPEQRRGRDGKPKVTSEGKPVLETGAWSQDFEKAMYRVGCDASPNVAAKITASCRGEVLDLLKANMPYNHPGNAKFRWQAILWYEVTAPSYRDGTIPVPCQDAILAYNDELVALDGKGKKRGGSDETKEACQSSAVLRFPLLSNTSGFDTKAPIVSLNIGELPPGKRRWLRQVAQGKAKLCDSKLICKDGRWEAHLMLKPEIPDGKLDAGRCAILTPMPPGSKRPFELQIPGDNGKTVRMFVGDGRPYDALYRHYDLRDKAIRARSRGGRGSGHGRGDFYRKVRPIGRAKQNEQDRFTKQLLSDVVTICLRNNCGFLMYREPTMPLRNRLWFADRGIPFDWSKFDLSLRHKCAFHQIETPEGRKKSGGWPRFSMQEHLDEYAKEWGRNPAVEPGDEHKAQLPCAICGDPVELSDERMVELVKADELPVCRKNACHRAIGFRETKQREQ